MPPWSRTAPTISSRWWLISSITCCGERCSEALVNPRRSVKSTVPSTSSPPRRRSESVRLSTSADDRLGNEAREDVPHLLPLERGQDDVHAERADRRERERGERIDERDDPAVVERELHGDRERARRRANAGGQRDPEPGCRARAPGTSSEKSRIRKTVERESAMLAQRQAAQDGRDRVRLDLAARHQRVDRRLVDVLERGAAGPITTILSREGARRDAAAVARSSTSSA